MPTHDVMFVIPFTPVQDKDVLDVIIFSNSIAMVGLFLEYSINFVSIVTVASNDINPPFVVSFDFLINSPVLAMA